MCRRWNVEVSQWLGSRSIALGGWSLQMSSGSSISWRSSVTSISVTLLGSYVQNKQNTILGLLLHPAAACDLGFLLEELDENQTLVSESYSEDFKKLMDRLGFQNDIYGIRDWLHRVYGCLANAIQYLHNDDIRHKDIKPRNILLDRNDSLYVTDFGLSRDTADTSSSVTDSIERGTYMYCAPEVARYKPRCRAADIYSLGYVFLEINTVHRRLSLDDFENFRTENNDRSYQSPRRLDEWKLKLRPTQLTDIDCGIIDIVGIINKMVLPNAKDRPVIRVVCSSLYLLGDLVYFGKCCPSNRYQELVENHLAEKPRMQQQLPGDQCQLRTELVACETAFKIQLAPTSSRIAMLEGSPKKRKYRRDQPGRQFHIKHLKERI